MIDDETSAVNLRWYNLNSRDVHMWSQHNETTEMVHKNASKIWGFLLYLAEVFSQTKGGVCKGSNSFPRWSPHWITMEYILTIPWHMLRHSISHTCEIYSDVLSGIPSGMPIWHLFHILPGILPGIMRHVIGHSILNSIGHFYLTFWVRLCDFISHILSVISPTYVLTCSVFYLSRLRVWRFPEPRLANKLESGVHEYPQIIHCNRFFTL